MNAGPAGSLAAAAWELAVPELPFGLEGTQEEADLAAEDEQDTLPPARRQLCESLAVAVVLRAPLPPAAAAALSDRSALSTAAHAGACVRALSLGLAGDDGGALLHLPLMVVGGTPSASAVLGPGAAAFESFRTRSTLVWRASDGCPPPSADWRALLQAAPGSEGAAPPAALVAVPLQASAAQYCLGAASFALESEPSPADVAVLQELGASLAASISHLTKNLWEESLGFLNTVMPRRVIQRMLSTGLAPRAAPAAVAAAGQRAQRVPAVEPAVVAPEAEPSNPSPRSPAFVADAAAGEAAAPPLLQLSVPEAAAARPACGGSAGGEGREGGDLYLATPTAASSEGGIEAYAATPSNEALPPSAAICGSGSIRHVAPGEAEPAVGVPGCAGSGALPDLAACGSDCSVGGGSAEPAGGSLSLGAAPKPAACSSGSSCKEGLDRGGVRGELELAGPPGSANAFLEIKTLRQKWNLEFADPLLEDKFKHWFNTLQTATDLDVFRYFCPCLLTLLVALTLRGGTTWGDWIAVTHSLLALVALAAFMLLRPAFYIAHRSTVVACVRCVSATLLLGHVYVDPRFYSGNLMKGLAASGSLTLVTNSFRNRLRFSNHLLVQLVKLYACALANAFTHSDPARSAATYLTLPVATAVQLLSAAIPSLAVFRLEAGLRRRFLAVGVQAGILQLPPAAPHTAAALLCPRPPAHGAAAKTASSI